LLLFGVIVQIAIELHDIKEAATLRYVGKLERPSATLLSTSQNIFPRLRLGNSKAYIGSRKQSGQLLFKFFEDVALKIWVDNGQLKLSTKIRDKNGDIIAEIIANEWRMKQENNWDRNFNENSIEVKDSKGDVVLQVILHDDCIQFSAKMYSRKGDGLAIGSGIVTEKDFLLHSQGKLLTVAAANGPKEVTIGDTTGVFETKPTSPGLPLELKIDPIFKYPSNLHLGELLN